MSATNNNHATNDIISNQLDQLNLSPRDSLNNIHKSMKSKSMGAGKKQKGNKNHYGYNKQNKKQLEQQLKKAAEESKANSYFSCDCQVCKTQVQKGTKFEIKKTLNLSILQGKKLQFSKLIEYMLPPNEKVKGCQVLFPDTVFFGHGKPQFIAKCDREGCLMIIQQQSKLALQDIRQKFSTIVRERKKETQPIIFYTNNNNNNSLTRQTEQQQDDSGKQTKNQNYSPSPNTKNSMSLNNAITLEDEGQKQNNDEKSIFYKDTAVFRFIVEDSQNNNHQQEIEDLNMTMKSHTNNFFSNKNNNNDATSQQQIHIQDQINNIQPYQDINTSTSNDESDNFQTAAVKVVRDTEFINEFRRRANDEFWKTIDCIQTSVKSKTGIGHPIFVNFMAPINESDPSKDIDYSHFKVMQEDGELLKSEEEDLFCYKQCLKIAYYVSKVYNYEILQMKAEFLKDENGNIWFFYASNIHVRPTKNRISPAYNLRASASQKANEQKEQLIQEIEQYEQEQNVQQNKSIGRMLNIMDSYYSNMKQDMGIFEKKDFTEEDNKLDEVLRVLRPNTTAKNFKEFLSRQDNINRTTHWKNIARKMDNKILQYDENTNHIGNIKQSNQINNQIAISKQKQLYYMNKRTMSHDQRKTQQMQSLINALDVSALGPKGKDIKTKDLMKVLNNLNQSTNYSDANNNNNVGNTQKSVNLLGQTHRSLFQYSGPYSNAHDSYIGSAHQQREQRSNFKAELVRNELLSRSDLMKLYQPPLKKSQLPTNNPFYTKTIVQLGQQLQPQLNLSQFRGNIIIDNPYGNENNKTNLNNTQNLDQFQSTNYNTKLSNSITNQRNNQQQQFSSLNNSLLNQKQQQINVHNINRDNIEINYNNNTGGNKSNNHSTIKTNSSQNNNNFNNRGGDQTELQSVLSYSQNGNGVNNNQQSTYNNINNKQSSQNNSAGIVNWSNYQGTQKLARQITKRMEYLKLTETFKHQET